MKNRNVYSYNGRVLIFGEFAGRWNGDTVASSEAEARRNLMYQYKKSHHFSNSTKVSFPDKIQTNKEE